MHINYICKFIILIHSLNVLVFAQETCYNGFQDALQSYNTKIWGKSNNYSNGGSFGCGWREDHINFSESGMSITIDDIPCKTNTEECSDKPYAAGELASHEDCGFGRYECIFKPPCISGTVSSCFTYSAAETHDEIDIEFFGDEVNAVYFTIHLNGTSYPIARHELSYKANESFHTYAFDWSADSVVWYVDNVEVARATKNISQPIPSQPSKFVINNWNGANTTYHWLGVFDYHSPVVASYRSISYVPQNPCESATTNNESTTTENNSSSDNNDNSKSSHLSASLFVSLLLLIVFTIASNLC